MKRSSAMINVKDIRLTPEELDQCIDFARRSAPTQQKIEFGSHDTKPRDPKEVARDNLIGKIAEVAFSKMMKANYGLDIPLDFEIYPRGKWDQQGYACQLLCHVHGLRSSQSPLIFHYVS